MNDEELRKILRTIRLDDPGESFTDDVMSIVEAQGRLRPHKTVTPVLTKRFAVMMSGAVLLVFVLALVLPGSLSHRSPANGYFRFLRVVGSGFLSIAGTVLVYSVPLILLLVVDYFLRVRRRLVG